MVYISVSKYSLDELMWSKKLLLLNCKSGKSKYSEFLLALEEYGIENFEIFEIASCDDKQFAQQLKKQYIEKYQSNISEYGYNRKTGRVKKNADVNG